MPPFKQGLLRQAGGRAQKLGLEGQGQGLVPTQPVSGWPWTSPFPGWEAQRYGPPPRTCVAGALAPDLAPRTLALFHLAPVHAGPAIAHLQVLVAALVKAFLWGRHSEPLLPARAAGAPLPCSPHPAHPCRSPCQ